MAFQLHHPVGTVVRVRYLPDSPEFNHLTDRRWYRRVEWLLGLALISIFPVLFTIGLLQTWITGNWKNLRKSSQSCHTTRYG